MVNDCAECIYIYTYINVYILFVCSLKCASFIKSVAVSSKQANKDKEYNENCMQTIRLNTNRKELKMEKKKEKVGDGRKKNVAPITQLYDITA